MFGGLNRLKTAWHVMTSREPAALATREVTRYLEVSQGTERGYERPTSKLDERYRVFEIERGRFYGYRDDWTAICESQLVEHALMALAEDSTAEPFDIKCSDARAEKEMWELLERVGYWQKRTEYMMRMNGLGDVFLILDRDFSPSGKRNLAEIYNMRVAAEYTMFRRATPQGYFRDLNKAFLQLSGIELVGAGGEGSRLVNGEKFYANGGDYSALAGLESRYGYQTNSQEVIDFAADEVIHGRLRPSWQPAPNGYGVSAQRSNHISHNVVMMCVQDLAVARKLATFNRIGHEFDKDATDDSVTKYIQRVLYRTDADGNVVKDGSGNPIRREVGPAEQYFIKGGKVVAIDAQNRQLVEIGDLDLHIDMLELGIGYPLALAGFRAHRINGQIMERMELRLKRTIRFQNRLEEYAIVRPLIDRQMFFSGKLGVKYELVFPEMSLEDSNKKVKRELSKVQTDVISRRRAFINVDQGTSEEFDTMLTEMEQERKILGPVQTYQAPGESLSKGKQGVERKGPETQDIAGTQSTVD